MNCRNCKKKLKSKILDLNSQPVSSVFYNKPKKNLKKYSLDLYICRNCNLIQFKELAPLDDMYGQTYGYRTSLSNYMIEHIKEKHDRIIKKKILSNKDAILDIGSNDGTFLNYFAKLPKDYKLNGVDPSAKKFLNLYDKKIDVSIDFFNLKFAKKSFKKNSFKLITSFAMFYDVEDPNGFCEGINYLLSKNGRWIAEFSYFPMLLSNLTYDQICHEHVTYYTLTTFKQIIEKNGLKLSEIRFNEINGGSIEVVCVKKSSNVFVNKKSINMVLDNEKTINDNSYNNLQVRIDNCKSVLNFLFSTIKSSEIIGYGASTKGNIVLNQCGINSKQMKYICDANPEKYGKYTPGSNIKIISKKEMRRKKPKYLLVLIWSFRNEVIKQEIDFIKAGGKLVIHLPVLHIVDKNNYKTYLQNSFENFAYSY